MTLDVRVKVDLPRGLRGATRGVTEAPDDYENVTLPFQPTAFVVLTGARVSSEAYAEVA